MTRRRTSIRAKLILGFLVVLAIFILPPTARAQTCGSPGVTTQVTNFSVSPSTIIAWSGVATGTITLNCTEPSNTTFALSSNPAGSLLFRADPSNPCGGICIPAGSSTGTFQVYSGQVAQSTTYQATSDGIIQAPVTVNPLIATLSISPSTLVGSSNQTALASVTLNGPMLQADYVTVACPYPGCYPFAESNQYIQIPTGATTCTAPHQPAQASDCITITAGQVPQSTSQTFFSYY